jgi:hypothetical protein
MKIIVRVRVGDGVIIRVRGRSLKCSYQAIYFINGRVKVRVKVRVNVRINVKINVKDRQ